MNRRSTKLVLAGAAVFIIGCTLAFVGIAGADDNVPVTVDTPAVTAAVEDATGETSTQKQDASTGQKVTQVTEPAVAVTDGDATTIVIPEGLDAVAITVTGPAGLLSYAKPGDLVDVYATVASAPMKMKPPLTKRVAPHAVVIDVRPVAAETTYLLGVDPVNAERIIFFSKFESVWLVLSGRDVATRGPIRRYGNVL